uniref:Exocyst subunit Exo70 family protein n=1 Tax=Gongylonema pulchrum TaxID=637853 RepID=A0A183DUN8_9BILA
LEDKVEWTGYISAALSAVIEVIDMLREHCILEIGDDLRWTQEGRVLVPFIQHLDILFGCIESVGKNSAKYLTLLKQAIVFSAFILNEQTSSARQNSPIITKFLEIDQRSVAVDLSQRFQVFFFIFLLYVVF